MALNSTQQASKLSKKLLFGVAETSTSKDFYEESFIGKIAITPDQILSQWNEVPLDPLTNAQALADAIAKGVLEHVTDLVLIPIPNTHSFYHEQLKGAIPFNHGDGGYNYQLKTSANVVIPFGSGDWVIDTEAGVLTFYDEGIWPAGVSESQPPKVSFYRYTGSRGASDPDIASIKPRLVNSYKDEIGTQFPRREDGKHESLTQASNSVLIGDTAYLKAAIINYFAESAFATEEGQLRVLVSKNRNDASVTQNTQPDDSITGLITTRIDNGLLYIDLPITSNIDFYYNIERII